MYTFIGNQLNIDLTNNRISIEPLDEVLLVSYMAVALYITPELRPEPPSNSIR